MDSAKRDRNLIWLRFIHAKKKLDCKIKHCVNYDHFFCCFLLFYLAQKIYVKTPGFKASKFQVHNKYRAPLDKCSPYINWQVYNVDLSKFFRALSALWARHHQTTAGIPKYYLKTMRLIFNPIVTDSLPDFTTIFSTGNEV